MSIPITSNYVVVLLL